VNALLTLKNVVASQNLPTSFLASFPI
ncbi:MAG: hypothetical protein JWQ07_4331, partial [Ramlibacter sp.]|nr:hypothetical protein [Ramlibacter sp.]